MNSDIRTRHALLGVMLVILAVFAVSSPRHGFGEAHDDSLPVRLVKTEQGSIEVHIGDQPFTEYHYGLGLQKPIFHPVRSPRGNLVTRQYPMKFGVPGERTDHWHHESLWFTFGDVNGVDFWARIPPRRDHSGSGKIVHTGFSQLESGDAGILKASADWVAPDGKVLLKQQTKAVFRGSANLRQIDLLIELHTAGEAITFGDTKEGMLGFRVAAPLREDQTGHYFDAKGRTREAEVWGKRSPWVAISGTVNDEPVTVAILNYPKSAGFPTYWHARGYGLFAANPFGRKDFVEGSEPVNFQLEEGESAFFGYRILIYSGKATPEQLEGQFAQLPAQ